MPDPGQGLYQWRLGAELSIGRGPGPLGRPGACLAAELMPAIWSLEDYPWSSPAEVLGAPWLAALTFADGVSAKGVGVKGVSAEGFKTLPHNLGIYRSWPMSNCWKPYSRQAAALFNCGSRRKCCQVRAPSRRSFAPSRSGTNIRRGSLLMITGNRPLPTAPLVCIWARRISARHPLRPFKGPVWRWGYPVTVISRRCLHYATGPVIWPSGISLPPQPK